MFVWINHQVPRIIGHIDLDCFFVSVECLKQPHLKGKPIIVGGTSQRGVVSACSYEARKFGVHSAMPMVQAMRLCPDAIIVKGAHQEYGYYSAMVTDIIRDQVPVFEKASIDEFYIDLTGMDKYFGCAALGKQLKQKIVQETGLPLSYGMGTSRMISKLAANEAKPNGYLEVLPGTECDFLWKLPVEKMHMIGNKTTQVLHYMGIRTLGALAATPVELLEERMGKTGRILWERAHGIDNSEVVPYREQKSISKEETYMEDTVDVEFLQSRLVGLTERVCFELRQLKRHAATLTLKLRYSNFETFSRQITLQPTMADHILIPQVKKIFLSMYDPKRKVRLIGVRLSQLTDACIQGDLFQSSDQQQKLYYAIDQVRDTFGKHIIQSAGGHLLKPKNL